MAQKYSYHDFLPDQVRALQHCPLPARESEGLEGSNHPYEFWERLRATRAAQYAASEIHICAPVHKVPRFLIPDATWVYENKDEMKKLAQEWKRLDPEFEVIYDPLTARGGPGYHLYRVIKGGYKGACDWLILEDSIQRDMTKGWPDGGPCRPTPYHVEFFRRHMKINRGGDAQQAHRASMQARWEGQLAPYVRTARNDAAVANEVHEEVTDPYLLRNKEIPGLAKWRTSQRNPKTPTLRLRFPAKYKDASTPAQAIVTHV